jgi:8-oxo-dGTP pyrophosphatase MutT (NUDIX family)
MAHKSHDIQFAALPWRISERGRRQVMLLTTRETRRWMIPKGWPMKSRKPTEVASQEAYEEAGLVGRIVGKRPLGIFHYEKQLTKESRLCQVHVFSFRVERQLDDWPEKQQRETKWFDATEAAALVEEDGLSGIITRFGGSYVRFVAFRKTRRSKKHLRSMHTRPTSDQSDVASRQIREGLDLLR